MKAEEIWKEIDPEDEEDEAKSSTVEDAAGKNSAQLNADKIKKKTVSMGEKNGKKKEPGEETGGKEIL